MAGAALLAVQPAYAQERGAQDKQSAAPVITPADLTAYVRARAADADGAVRLALAGYANALARVPDNETVAIRTYRQAVAAGDIALARQAAAALARADAAPADSAVLDFAAALKSGDRTAEVDALAKLSKGPFDFMVPVLDAWMAFDRGGDPFAPLEAARANPLARRYADIHHALLLIATGKGNEGMSALPALLASAQDGGSDIRLAAAELLAASGDKRAARALIPGDRSEQEALRKRIGKGPRVGAAFGVSRLFLGLVVDLAQEDIPRLSIVLSRAALMLDPQDDRARLYLADALSRTGAHDMALDVLAAIPDESPFARGAVAGTIAALDRAGRTDEAITRARTLAAGRDATGTDLRTLGDLLFEEDQFDAAATAYRGAIDRPGGADDWRLHLQLGTALDRANEWEPAKAALARAVELAPDEPAALTTFGSAQIERREHVPEAQALLERAKSLKPDDAGIADSLAWAYYLGGDVEKALPLLEDAAKSDPGGALVNEHLGDAYWRLGRRYEARYAWRAAAIYAEDDAVARIKAKLADGLGPKRAN